LLGSACNTLSDVGGKVGCQHKLAQFSLVKTDNAASHTTDLMYHVSSAANSLLCIEAAFLPLSCRSG